MTIVKKILVVIGALAVGVIGGWIWGLQGKAALKEQMKQSVIVSETEKAELETALSTCRDDYQKQERLVQLFRAAVTLQRALVDLSENNFGLSSRRLGEAHAMLKTFREKNKEYERARFDKIMSELSNAHSLAMRLDAMARSSVERVLTELDSFLTQTP